MKFQEVINDEKAKYIYNLSDSYWSTAIFSNEEENEDGNKYTQKDYIANCKKWLSKGIKKKGNLKTDYKFSKYMLDKGRIYVKVFGIQSLQRDLRGFLCSDDYIDIDMKNAHNNILFFMIFPSGLVLYWTVNNLLSMLQQWYVNRQLEASKKSSGSAKKAVKK